MIPATVGTSTSVTKAKILDTAEKLFGDKGFDATSLRDITTEAQVNLAAVNYHFHSKESLIDAVIALTVIYKAFENLGGFRRIGWRLDSRAAVLLFGLDIVVGYTGQVSLGHAGLFGIGAYTAGVMFMKLSAPFWLILPASIAPS